MRSSCVVYGYQACNAPPSRSLIVNWLSLGWQHARVAAQGEELRVLAGLCRVHLQHLGHPIANDTQYGGMLGDPSIPLTSRLQVQTIHSDLTQPIPINEPAAASQQGEVVINDCSKEAGQPESAAGQDAPPASKRPCLANSRGSDSNACDASGRTTAAGPQHILGIVRQGQSSLLPAAGGTTCRAANSGQAAAAGTEPEAKEDSGHADTPESALHMSPSQPDQLSGPHAAEAARADLSLQAAHVPANFRSPEHLPQRAGSGHTAGDAAAVPSQALPLDCHEGMICNGNASCSKPELAAAGARSAAAVSNAAASPKQMGDQDAEAQGGRSKATSGREGVSSAEVLPPGARSIPGTDSAAGAEIAR